MTRQDTTDTTQTNKTNDEAARAAASSPETADTSVVEEVVDKVVVEPTQEELIEAAKAEAAAFYDRYLRAVADHENFRKRAAREKDELRKYASSRVLEDLLPVLDNLGLGLMAINQPNADVKTIADGVGMVQTQLKGVLDQHGLKEVNPAGEAFDAHQHEALSQQPSEEVPEGNVITVVRVGYSLNGRLLRPASVIVSSGAPKEAAND